MTLPNDRTVITTVNQFLERLVSVFQPQYVYLFGSRARGDHTDNSDHDSMVILPDDAPEELLKWPFPYRALAALDLGRFKDVKFKRQSDFTRQLHLKASIPSGVLRDGRF